MERSLTAVLPVRNAQATLAKTVMEMLEVLSELTARLEIVIVDDGSTDATIEVADELARRYPQMSAIRHAQPLGRPAAIRTALEQSTGEVIFLEDENCTLAIDEIHKLWHALDEHECVMGRAAAASQSIGRRWHQRTPAGQGGFQMLYRRAIQRLRWSVADHPGRGEDVWQNGCLWHEVEVGQRILPRGPHRPAGRPSRRPPAAADLTHAPTEPDKPRHQPAKPKRPNFLAKFKDFALGE